MVQYRCDRRCGHRVFAFVFHCEPQQVLIAARRVIPGDTLLIDLRVLRQPCEERLQLSLVKLLDALSRENTWVLGQQVQVVRKFRNRVFLVLPIVLNHLYLSAVGVKSVGNELFVQVEIVFLHARSVETICE